MVTASSFSLKNFIASSRISLDQELSSVILVNASLPQIPSKTREALKEVRPHVDYVVDRSGV